MHLSQRIELRDEDGMLEAEDALRFTAAFPHRQIPTPLNNVKLHYRGHVIHADMNAQYGFWASELLNDLKWFIERTGPLIARLAFVGSNKSSLTP